MVVYNVKTEKKYVCWFSWVAMTMISNHCVVTEKVTVRYGSLKMADASLGKCSIFVDWGGIACARHRLSVHMGRKGA